MVPSLKNSYNAILGDRHVRKPYNSVISVALELCEAQCGVQTSPLYPGLADSRGQESFHKGRGPRVPCSHPLSQVTVSKNKTF